MPKTKGGSATRLSSTLSRLQGGRLRPEQKLRLYRSVVLPAITYASPVWWEENCPDCRMKSRVISLQRSVLLHLSGAFRTTRTAALQVLMRAPPILLELERLNTEFRLFTLRMVIRYGGLFIRPDEVIQRTDLFDHHPAHLFEMPFRRLTVRQATLLARNRGIHIYTDGSYSEGTAGAAYVVFGPADRIAAVGRFSLTGATSAFCAETTALTKALQWLQRHPTSHNVYVYTDCLSLLQAVSTRTHWESPIMTIKRTLQTVRSTSSISLYHVPAHSGIFGNEVAGYIASRAARHGEPKTVPCSERTATRRLQSELYRRWAEEWASENSDTALYNWVPDRREIPQFFPPNRPLVTLLTAHGRFHTYFHRFNLLPDATCNAFNPVQLRLMTTSRLFLVAPVKHHTKHHSNTSGSYASFPSRSIGYVLHFTPHGRDFTPRGRLQRLKLDMGISRAIGSSGRLPHLPGTGPAGQAAAGAACTVSDGEFDWGLVGWYSPRGQSGGAFGSRERSGLAMPVCLRPTTRSSFFKAPFVGHLPDLLAVYASLGTSHCTDIDGFTVSPSPKDHLLDVYNASSH
ncbi:hypothetical protein HPB52_024246 [Rhipicephalus sanguineus]|uniref:RNase H type-1 domain-containing protein n=1 Tax=Rhipicephalus sanguineus TaxID=34632 RepID=A0A9D4TCM6_RHISA|nr:hypothetical protein HPB52_024246 [Rhipicephalus sanguineus]